MIYYSDNEISIRDICEKDVIRLFSWWIDAEINVFDPRPLPFDTDTLLRECESYCKGFRNEVMNDDSNLNIYKYFIVTDTHNKPIGFINLFDFNKEKNDAELGIIIGNKFYWNKGLGYKCCRTVLDYVFNEMNLSRVHIETTETNIPSRGLFSKLGFEQCDEYDDEGVKAIVMEMDKKKFNTQGR